MKKLNIALTILMSLGLVACGSSGGDNSAQPTNQPTNNGTLTNPDDNTGTSEISPSASLPKEEKAQDTTPYTKPFNSVGAGFRIIGKDLTDIAISTDGQYKKIYIEGKDLDIIPPGIIGNNIAMGDSKLIREGYAGKYTYAMSLYGSETNNNYYAIASGTQATKDMPTQGVINYEGGAISAHLFDGDMFVSPNQNVNLIADFNEKTLTGTITERNANSTFETVNLSADITQNTFTGNVGGVKVQGGFFGPQAAEIAGDYVRQGENLQTAVGVFQASKK